MISPFEILLKARVEMTTDVLWTMLEYPSVNHMAHEFLARAERHLGIRAMEGYICNQSTTETLWGKLTPDNPMIIGAKVPDTFTAALATRCECDYDGDCDGYHKCSHYCPVHDECEGCEAVLGVVKDSTWDRATERRPRWLCTLCHGAAIKEAKETADLRPDGSVKVDAAMSRAKARRDEVAERRSL